MLSARDGSGGAAGAEAAARRYATYAGAFLATTVVAGTWMRVALLWPAALARLDFKHAVHAHSHVALFGWTTMALFALVVRATGDGADPGRWTRWHAHAVGVASAAAFAGLLLVGYSAPTIALASLHVLLWVAFAAGSWRSLGGAAALERRYFRGALTFLVLAGAGAMAPGLVRARGITDPWLSRLSLELFLTPFVEGWLGLGVAGALYGALYRARDGRVERPRFAAPVFWLLAGSAVPAACFRVAAEAPAGWLFTVGRLATLGTGAGALMLAVDVLRAPLAAPLLRLAGAAALLKGAADVGAALAAAGPALAGNHQLTVAYLHLVLLGVVTPALLGAMMPPYRAVARLTALHAAGLLATLAALCALGQPWAGALGGAAGLSARVLLAVALAGGALSAGAVLGILAAARGYGVTPAAAAARPASPTASSMNAYRNACSRITS